MQTADPTETRWQPEDHKIPASREDKYRAALERIAAFQRTAPQDLTLSEALDQIEAIARDALA